MTCYKKTEEGGIEVLDEGECSGKKPELEEPCSNENSCEAADWIVSGACLDLFKLSLNTSTDTFISSDKSSCEGVCGLTHSSMHAICADGTGQQVGRVKERHYWTDGPSTLRINFKFNFLTRSMQVAEDEEDRCDQAEDKKPPTEEVGEDIMLPSFNNIVFFYSFLF